MNKFLSRGLFLLAFWAMLPGCYASTQTSQNKAVLNKETKGGGCLQHLSSRSATQKKQNSTAPSTQNSGDVYVLQSQMSPAVLAEQKGVFSKQEFKKQQELSLEEQYTAHHSIGIDVNVECGIKRGKEKVGYGAIARLGFGFAVFNKNQPSKKKSSENDLQISDTKNRFSVTGTVTPFISLYDKVAFGPVLGLKWSTLHLAKGFERSNILSIPVGLEVIVAASDNLSVVLAYRYEICVWKSKILNGVKCGNHYVGLSCSCKLYSAKSGFYVAANAGLNYNCMQFKFDSKGADAYKDLIAKFENASGSDKKRDANEAASPFATQQKQTKK